MREPLPLARLPIRETDSHKGDHGRVLVVAGSMRYPGAALLCALGAGRAGAGLVELAVPEGVGPLVLPGVPFAILRECPATPRGGFSGAGRRAILESAAAADSVVLGPGLGDDPETWALVRDLLPAISAPLVLDADGLSALEQKGAQLLADRTGPTVLTPHPGEFARLDGRGRPQAGERSTRAAQLANEFGAVVVLKGHQTVVTDGRRLGVEQAGNPGMAAGGSGDVLAGILGALLAVLDDPAQAVALGVHLHAEAGDLAARELGQECMLPTDLAARFGRALEGWRMAGMPGARRSA